MLSTVNCQGIAALSQNKIKGLKTPNADKELEQLDITCDWWEHKQRHMDLGKQLGNFLES